MVRPTSWLLPLFALGVLVLRCGSDGEGQNSNDSEPRGGEGGGEDGGSPGESGATTTGGRGGTSGNGGTSGRGGASGRGGTEARGGTAGRSTGGVSGDAGSGTGGDGDPGGDAGQGGGGAAGTPAGGEGGEGGTGGCHDPPSTKLCTNDLSEIGTGDFEIKFTIRAGGNQRLYAIMGQRAVCGHGYFWSVRILDGWLYVELDDDNQNYVSFWPYDYLVDGNVHRVVIRRISGVLSTMLDCGTPSFFAAPTDLAMTLAPLSNATNDVCIGIDTAPLEGFVTDHCVRPL
jgi:hypothetical protein